MKTVLITGAGIGIGKATAFAFAKDGYRVIVTDVLVDEGNAVTEEIKRAGGSAEFHALDVTSTDRTNEVIAAVEASGGAIDTLVCNAGIAHKFRWTNSATKSGTTRSIST